jgi:ribosomal protein S18 acetylase RimI-like enzyme
MHAPGEIQPPRAVRLARADDADALVAIDRAAILDGRGMVLALDQLSTVEDARRAIDGMDPARASSTWVVQVAGEVVASGALRQLWPRACEHVAILSVTVHPAHQRRGHGRALVSEMMEHARDRGIARLELYVRADNHRAKALYRSLGFVHEATRRGFIKTPEGRLLDDEIFVRWLRGSE